VLQSRNPDDIVGVINHRISKLCAVGIILLDDMMLLIACSKFLRLLPKLFYSLRWIMIGIEFGIAVLHRAGHANVRNEALPLLLPEAQTSFRTAGRLDWIHAIRPSGRSALR
jgi:hypothetical protein